MFLFKYLLSKKKQVIVLACGLLFLITLSSLNFKTRDLNKEIITKKEYDNESNSENRTNFLDFKAFLATKTGPMNLPDLTVIDWPKYSYRTGPVITLATKSNFTPFQIQISLKEKLRVVNLLKIIYNKLYQNYLGLCMFATGGTRLGSYRHHDFIPWDDDWDLNLDELCVKNFTIVLNELQPQIKYYNQPGKIKIYWGSDVPTSNFKWNWPYLDVLIFSKNETHITEKSKTNGVYLSYTLGEIYPLIYRPFGEIWLPNPANILSTLVVDYGATNECWGPYYSHILEDAGVSDRKKCEDLGEQFAFVERKLVRPTETSDPRFVWIEETLFFRKRENKLKKQKVHSLILVGHVTSITTSPYDLIMKL